MQTVSDICKTLHSAIENCDVERMINLYADNAELRIIDRNHPPSRPLELRGKQAIAGHLRDIFGRQMTHKVVNEVVGNDNLSFSEECQYPDGTRVYGNATLSLINGKIMRETEVQAWDETMH